MAKLIGLLAISAILIPISVYGIQMEPQSYHARRFHSGSYLMLPAFTLLAVYAGYRIANPFGAPVRIDPSGFRDLRVSRQAVPWNQISNVVGKGEVVSLTLHRKFAASYPMSFTQRLLKATRASAGPTHLLVSSQFLRSGSTELFDLLEAYWIAHRDRAGKDQD